MVKYLLRYSEGWVAYLWKAAEKNDSPQLRTTSAALGRADDGASVVGTDKLVVFAPRRENGLLRKKLRQRVLGHTA